MREDGVVLVSASGCVPTLTEAIAGGKIKGSWWGHPNGKQICPLLEEVREHADMLVCRLIDDKLTHWCTAACGPRWQRKASTRPVRSPDSNCYRRAQTA